MKRRIMDEAITFFKNLVAIPSVSTQESSAANYLVKYMKNNGFLRAYSDEVGNAIGIRGNGKTVIVFLGHIDTVPGDIEVVIHDNKLYGRGSVDAKGPLAACTVAVASMSEEDLAGKTIIVIGAVEEEISTSKGAYYVRECFNPSYCIIGEPSGWNGITLGYKGIISFTYSCTVPLQHHSHAEASAIKQGLRFLHMVEDYLRPLQGEQSFLSPFLEVRSLNSYDDGKRQTLEAGCAVRIPPEFDKELFFKFLQEKKGVGEINITQQFTASVHGKSNPLVASFLSSIRDNGGVPRFLKKTGSSDMCVVAEVWKCPMIAYGPGDSSLDHTPHEHSDLDDYMRSIVIMRNALKLLP